MIPKHIIKPAVLAAMLGVAATASAVPARPGIVAVAQPDGTMVDVRISGDETLNWVATPDGYTLLRDAKGFLTFARSEKGLLKASELRYNGNASVSEARAKGFEKNLRPAADTKLRKASSTQVEGTFPAIGKHKLLMLLINFADTQPTYISRAFDAYMNTEGFASTGSFRDFYLENSYGQLDIQTTVTDWITVPHPKSYYNTDNVETLITEALEIIDSKIDLRDFDNDGDGVLDGLAIIHQGTGAEASGSSADIWSHSGAIYGKSFDGVRLQRYTIQPEILYDAANPNVMASIGVMCHEFGHNLGAPDFYDTDYALSGGEYSGTGTWDLMGGGAWNGPGFSGTQPAGINMWQKIQLGWVTPEQLSDTKSITGMKAAHNNPVAYRFDTTEPGEYFILENRQQEGRFDSALPYHGLIIYHVNDNMIAENVVSNTLNVKYPQAMYTVCSAANMEPSENPGSYGWVNSEMAPFPGKGNITIFHDNTMPSTRSMSGRYSYKGLTKIQENPDGTIDFDFLSYNMPESPVDLSAQARAGVVTLDWKVPSSETPESYNVYRNGTLIANLATPGYTDREPGSVSTVTYDVDAVYNSGLISPYSRVQIFLPVNLASAFNGSVDGDNVTLTWDLNTRLSRMPSLSDNFETHDYLNKSVEVAHRFRAEDLNVYRGYDIRYINFLAMQNQKNLGVTVRVYEQTPGTDEMKILSERKVSEFATMQWYSALLTKVVKITGEKDIIISVRYESKNSSSVQVLCDLEPAIPGYGNLSRLDDGEWAVDHRAEGNFFIAATLRAPEAAEGVWPESAPVVDFLADTAYPLGFVVYRDGVEVGRTDGRSYTDKAPFGDHVYTLTSLYKGDNESSALETGVHIDKSDSVEEVGSALFGIHAAGGQIHIAGVDGTAEVLDLAGRRIARVAASGAEVHVSVPAGVYIVSTPGHVAKVLVR